MAERHEFNVHEKLQHVIAVPAGTLRPQILAAKRRRRPRTDVAFPCLCGLDYPKSGG
jgi:hypothetical protein